MNIFVNARFLTQKITGVQRYGIEVSRRLARLSDNITFVSPRNILHDKIAKELKAISYGKLRGHLWEQIDLPVFLKSQGKNGLLLNLGNTGPIRYGNQITTIHDLGFLQNPAWYSKKFYLLYKFLIPRIINKSRLIFTVSEFSKSEIIRKLNVAEKKIKIACCGVSPIFFDTQRNKKKDSNSRYILIVSSIDPRKNLAGVIKAFGKLKDSSIRLVIAGEKNRIFADSNINEDLLSSDRIDLKEIQDDENLRQLYSEAELLVFPSFYEGFGLPPLEAMACGCPCVVSNRTSLPEVCGDAALYCDPDNTDNIVEKIEVLLNDSLVRKEAIAKGHERARRFTWDKTASTIFDIVKEAAGK